MALDPITGAFDLGNTILGIGSKIIDKIWPDPNEAAKAKLALLQAEQAGEFKEIETRMQAIVAEANSSDPWTSRARPSFMYVMYLMLLAAIPFGFASVFAPDQTNSFVLAFGTWLRQIPDELYWLFGAGYLGYGSFRTIDKWRGKKGA